MRAAHRPGADNGRLTAAPHTQKTIKHDRPAPSPAQVARALARERAVEAETLAAVTAQVTHVPVRPVFTTYTVQPGDSVASIAQRFHDSAWLIRRRNGGLWNLAPGRTIFVWQWPFGTPRYEVRTTLIDHPQFYNVRSGDTLDGIAQSLKTDAATLQSANGLGGPDVIYAGQTLVLHHYTPRRARVLVRAVPTARLNNGMLLTDVANLVGIDAPFVKAVAWHETGWVMKRGYSGEIGMMQLMPYMARWVQRALIGYRLDPNVPVNNVLEGALLLNYYLDATHHNTHEALALYHSGNMASDHRNGLYIRAVLSLRRYFYHFPND